jgi:hypothetical protein
MKANYLEPKSNKFYVIFWREGEQLKINLCAPIWNQCSN